MKLTFLFIFKWCLATIVLSSSLLFVVRRDETLVDLLDSEDQVPFHLSPSITDFFLLAMINERLDFGFCSSDISFSSSSLEQKQTINIVEKNQSIDSSILRATISFCSFSLAMCHWMRRGKNELINKSSKFVLRLRHWARIDRWLAFLLIYTWRSWKQMQFFLFVNIHTRTIDEMNFSLARYDADRSALF